MSETFWELEVVSVTLLQGGHLDCLSLQQLYITCLLYLCLFLGFNTNR